MARWRDWKPRSTRSRTSPPKSKTWCDAFGRSRFDLQFIVTGAGQEVCLLDGAARPRIFLRASPIDVSGLLEDKLFEKVDTVVLTSATLSSAGNFSFIRERLGLDTADDLIAESTFDYQSQALLYLPPKMPDPRSREWAEAAAAEVIKIVNATEGRAFVLSTSLAGMQSLYDLAMPEIEYPCLLQGSAVERTAARKVSANAECGVVCDVEFLAGR